VYLGSHGMDFCEICIGVGLQKYVEKIEVCLKSNKNNRHFAFSSTFIDDFISTYLSVNQLDRKRGQLEKQKKILYFTSFYFHTVTTFRSSEVYAIQRIILSLK
jgi:hypothetical protein